MNDLLKTAVIASIDAGLEILKIYYTDFDIEYKDDSSPLTTADKNAHLRIASYLEQTNIPILSEEGRAIPFDERKTWKKLWVVDPLDGTKEFIKKNDEFTVNIALVEDGNPILGVIYAPVLDILYYGSKDNGSFICNNASAISDNIADLFGSSDKLPLKNKRDYYGVVASRSHLSPETSSFINELKQQHDKIEIVSKGSSLKLCMVAEGLADIYPRFAPTSEWDTAAGQAIVESMGGKVVVADNQNKNVHYNKENILNPWFIAMGKGQ